MRQQITGWSLLVAVVGCALTATGGHQKGEQLSEPARSPVPVPAASLVTPVSGQVGAPAVTPGTLIRAGFKKQNGGYAHPQITIGELKQLLGFRSEDIQEIPNGPAGSPLGEVEFSGGRCRLDYAWMLFEPKDSLQDESNKVCVYLWFYR